MFSNITGVALKQRQTNLIWSKQLAFPEKGKIKVFLSFTS